MLTTLEVPNQVLVPVQVPVRTSTQSTQEYRAALLRYALADGLSALAYLSLEQLADLDSACQLATVSLPAKLSLTDHHVDAQLHALRQAIAARQARHRASWAQAVRAILSQGPSQGNGGSPRPGHPESPAEVSSPAEQAARLIKAGLIVLMGDQDDQGGGGGGKKARLQPPPRPLSPQGQARRLGDDIAF